MDTELYTVHNYIAIRISSYINAEMPEMPEIVYSGICMRYNYVYNYVTDRNIIIMV